ncbi:hypothetical protein BDK51DRAFT_40669 [Blyttiomyces helicus]|uniref:Uncharacterized protein n=1 Tax=Blyttiomyces helicus TaxID=388810 RepID=A0A4P9W3Y1_9FUNG|nr:hypothetical protein BDK51DRAFT_40669 [Blyttiomyces helicus]|eukprot:RKO85518.1 hypothetical protein BDK51DRAFT_40669 [Blyttiomyces helicus]
MLAKTILASAALAAAAVAAPISSYEKPSYPAPAPCQQPSHNNYQQPAYNSYPIPSYKSYQRPSPRTTLTVPQRRATLPRPTLLPTAAPTPAIQPRPTSSPLRAPLIQCASIACTPGQTPEYTQRALYQCYALESQAKQTNAIMPTVNDDERVGEIAPAQATASLLRSRKAAENSKDAERQPQRWFEPIIVEAFSTPPTRSQSLQR